MMPKAPPPTPFVFGIISAYSSTLLVCGANVNQLSVNRAAAGLTGVTLPAWYLGTGWTALRRE
jgi:hypothetical protein